MIRATVEMYGLSREVSGVPSVEVKLENNARLGDVITALRKEIPALEGTVINENENRLEDVCIFNINGQFYHDENDIPIKDGEHVRILSLATGG